MIETRKKLAGASLTQRVARAGALVISGHAASQLLRLCGNLIMTRLLAPEMFGIVSMAYLFIIGLSLASDFGIRQSIIRSVRGNDPLFLNTAWTAQIMKGILVFLIATAISGALGLLNQRGAFSDGSVYESSALAYVLFSLSFIGLFDGFTSTKIAVLYRNLDFQKIIRFDLLSQGFSLSVMILWALLDRSIWALVAGNLASAIVRMILSHKILPGQDNKLQFEKGAFSEIFGIGKWLFLTSILGFLATNGDRILLGNLIDPTAMGIFGIALFIVSSIRELFTKVIASVFFPAISEVIRTRPRDLKSTYYRIRVPLDLALLTLSGALFTSGHVIIEILYDDRYSSAGYMLEVLSISLVHLRFNLASQSFVSLGNPVPLVPLHLIIIIVLFFGIPYAFDTWGFTGVLWTVALSGLTQLPLQLYFKHKYELLNVRREIVFLPVFAIGMFIGSLIDVIL